jgi:hypothetical protein
VESKLARAALADPMMVTYMIVPDMMHRVVYTVSRGVSGMMSQPIPRVTCQKKWG